MLSFFKSSKTKIPKKGKSFYDRENLIQTVKELCNVIDRVDNSKITKTNSNILFQNIELDAITEKNLRKDFGQEAYCLEPDSGISNHRVYYYRLAFKDLRLLLQLHFFEDQFFFAATKVYSDALLTNADKQKVLNQIISTYHPNIDNHSFDLDIMDPAGNILFTQDNVFYYMKYLANNTTCQKLKKQYTGSKNLKSAKNKDTLDKLI